MVDVREVTRTYGSGATATAALRGVTFSIGEGKLVECIHCIAQLLVVLVCADVHVDIDQIVAVIERPPADIAVLIIEHDMDLVFRLARRITVLVQGRILVEGPPDMIAADPQVRQVYLGERPHGREAR